MLEMASWELKDGYTAMPEETHTYGNIEDIREQYRRSKTLAKEIIGSYSVHCKQNLFLMQLNKDSDFTWNFIIKSNNNIPIKIKRLFLLQSHMPEFYVDNVKVDFTVHKLQKNCQFWECSNQELKVISMQTSISFLSSSYGHFEQQLIFEFQNGDKILRNIGVEVLPEAKLMETLKFKPEKYVESEMSWIEKFKVIPFDGEPEISFETLKYPLSAYLEDLVSHGAFDNFQKKITRENYREWLHLLLHIEENERRKKLQQLSFGVDDINSFLYSPIPGLHKNRILKIPSDNTEQAYQLIGKSGKALIKICSPFDSKPQVFEVLLEQILCNEFVFELSSELDGYLQFCQCRLKAIFCFRFVDVFKFMHNAIDQIRISDVFPLHHQKPKETWNYEKYQDLTKEQSIALNKMIENSNGPPVLLLGPFGSGKTRTMAHAVLELYERMKRRNSLDVRILICTHSNSAADHYIENFIDPILVQEEPKNPVLIRVNWELRYTASVSPTVLKYCEVRNGKFVQPEKKDIERHIIVISTLVTANILHEIGIGRDFFTHIFIDEAAQAMEVEAIIPFMFKGEETKVILAGDHLQLGFPLVSAAAKDLGLGISLLERLFLEYPSDSQYKLKLLENHRSFKEIVEISSSLFYEGALISNKERPQNTHYPIQFFGIHGKEEISLHQPSVFNLMESNEILHCILNLMETWPNCLGNLMKSKICVLSCYAAQIQEIRLLLRRNSLGDVRVENVNNVQGLEFDVVIISTVRCYNELFHQRGQHSELGFLGNPKLLNTAITRAKYLCIVIGEPVALCSFGPCKGLWKTILAMSHFKGEFHYRLAYKEVMEMSENLCEILRDNHTIKLPLESIIIREEYLYDKHGNSPSCTGNEKTCEKSSSSLLLSTDPRNTRTSRCGDESMRLEGRIPQRSDFAIENSLAVSPAPSEMSYMSDLSSSNSQGPVFPVPGDLLTANGSKEAAHDDDLKMQENREVDLHNNGNNEQLIQFLQKQEYVVLPPPPGFPVLQYQPRYSSFQQYPLNPPNLSSFARISKAKSPDDIMEFVIEVDLINLFVSNFYIYSGNKVLQIQSYTTQLIYTKNEIMAELQHLRCNAQSFSTAHILQKCKNAHHFLIKSLHSMDTSLLVFLPVVSNNIFQTRQANFRSLKGSFFDLRQVLEELLKSLKLLVSVQGPMSSLYFEAFKLLDFIVFISREIDSWLLGHLTEDPPVKYSSLFEFKLDFLLDVVHAIERKAHQIEVDAKQFGFYRTLAFPIHDQMSLAERPLLLAGRKENSPYLDHDISNERKKHAISLYENRSNSASIRNSLPESCIEAKKNDTENESDIIGELNRLTMTENVFENVDGVDGLVSLIERLRYYDNDVNEWFINRETDAFVIEYIENFERYRASTRTSNNCPDTSSNQRTVDSKYFNGFSRFKRKVPYPQYCQLTTDMSKGVMSYEKSSSCEKPRGVILLGQRRIVFPDLEALNRSLDGDEVLFQLVGRYGEHERGRVERVIKRGVQSLLCKISLNDCNLLLPVDERGPPIIPLNASEPSASSTRHVGGSVRKYLVKVIGWPVEMKFPVGMIQREAQEHTEK